MSALEPDPNLGEQWHPTFVHSRREAIVIFGLWVACLLWVVPYCYINGFSDAVDPNNLKTTWGMPSWVVGGIIAPWLVADVFTIWFCFFYMQEDDLNAPGEEDDAATEGGSPQ